MDVNQVLEIIKPLADGVDPVTGEVFSSDSPYQHPQIIRALYSAMTALEKEKERLRRQKHLPKNAGKPWSEEEDLRLADSFDSGESMEALAKTHQRTKGAIESRLIRLGKIQFTEHSQRRQ